MKIIQLTDNSWILKSNDVTIGTLFKRTNGLLFMSPDKRKSYTTFEEFQKEWGIKKILNADDAGATPDGAISSEIDGYPIKHSGVKIIENSNPPQYIKGAANAKAVFAAGYWVVRNGNSWVAKLCPKIQTIEENDAQGPFKSRLEMNTALRKLNHEIKMSGVK